MFRISVSSRIPALIAAFVISRTYTIDAQQPFSANADSVVRAAAERGFSGVVRVQRNGSVVLRKGYGLANRETRAPFTPETVVQIGSNTKDFTVVALLQLHESGRLNLNDSIGKYFRSVPADKRGITLWHLVRHQSGLPLALGRDFEPLGRAALIDTAMRTRLLFPPGTREQYSNPGYSLLAAIIEQVTGSDYETHLRASIFEPLRMTNTGLVLPKFDPSRLAHGYTAAGADAGTMLSKAHAADGSYWNLRGNGGLISTVDDMHTFYDALFTTDKLMRPSTRALRFDPSSPIGLAGSDNISVFIYERDPSNDLEIIIASNNAAAPAPPVRRALSRLFEAAPAGDSKPVSPAVSALVSDFVRILNLRDAPALRAFVTQRFVPDAAGPTTDQRVERLMSFTGEAGTLTVLRTELAPDGVVARVRAANGDMIKMRIEIDGPPPHRIRRVQMQIGD
jgi:CubicO group peptidase (beta-lactamase class C family)